MIDQLQFMLDGANVKRYHTVTTLVPETVGHHSHGVALLVFMLSKEQPSSNLVFAALVHDLAEHQTGDMPSPSKRQMGISSQFTMWEENILEDSGWMHEGLTPEEARLLKVADIGQGALYCVEEIQRGNSKMSIVLDRYLSYAKSMNLAGNEIVFFNTIKDMLK